MMVIFYASNLLVLVLTFATGSSAHLGLRASKRRMQAVFPPYNQQCRNDSGPLYIDDAETFGNRTYHEGKNASAVGECPDPLKGACSQKPRTAAFLEGPIDCGGKGWFCRILEEPGWPSIALNTDMNFGHCNTTEAQEDVGFNRTGHCHGSDSDDAFYWFIRDYWYRQYVSRNTKRPARFVANHADVLPSCRSLTMIAAFASIPNIHTHRTVGFGAAAAGMISSRRESSSTAVTIAGW